MGKQYNKVIKRRRRAAYIAKRKAAVKELVSKSSKGASKAKPAKAKVTRKAAAPKKAKVVEKTPATDNKLKTPTKQRKRSKSIKDQSLEEIKEEEHEQTFRVGNEYA